MAIVKKSNINRGIEIDLTGPAGNAYALMGAAQDFCKQIGKSKEESDALLKEMKSGDYENLVAVFDREFGTFVTLLR